MKSARDPRHIARVLSVMTLYKEFFREGEQEFELDIDELELGVYSKKLYTTIIEGVREHYKNIDDIINLYSNPVKTEDLDTLLLQIVRVAVCESYVLMTVPPKVAVDEAIELTRDFGLEMASKKVAGILGRIFENKSAQNTKGEERKLEAENKE